MHGAFQLHVMDSHYYFKLVEPDSLYSFQLHVMDSEVVYPFRGEEED